MFATFVVTPVLNIPGVQPEANMENTAQVSPSAYSKSGDNQRQLWIYFIFIVFVRPCPLFT